MTTEHIFQIAIAVDDDTIKAQATKYCAEQISRALNDDYVSRGFYGRSTLGPKLSEVVEASCDKFLQEHKDVIIEEAAKLVANKVFRSKAFKEKVGNIRVTLDEKHKAIREFCKNRNDGYYGSCNGCQLEQICIEIFGNFEDNSDKTNEAYAIITQTE